MVDGGGEAVRRSAYELPGQRVREACHPGFTRPEARAVLPETPLLAVAVERHAQAFRSCAAIPRARRRLLCRAVGAAEDAAVDLRAVDEPSPRSPSVIPMAPSNAVESTSDKIRRWHAPCGVRARHGTPTPRTHPVWSTLDNRHAPELDRLYEFVLYQITQANLTSTPDPLAPAEKVLTELRSAWAELAGRR